MIGKDKDVHIWASLLFLCLFFLRKTRCLLDCNVSLGCGHRQMQSFLHFIFRKSLQPIQQLSTTYPTTNNIRKMKTATAKSSLAHISAGTGLLTCLIFASAFEASAQDISTDITEPVTYGDGAVVNIVENVSAIGATVSVEGEGAEIAPVLSIYKNKTLTIADGAALNMAGGVLSFGTEDTASTEAPSTIAVSGTSADAAGSVYLKGTVLRSYAAGGYQNSPKFVGSGYGSITLDATTFDQPSTNNWFSLNWEFADKSKFYMTNGAAIDYSQFNYSRGGSTMEFRGSSEFSMDKASVLYLYQYGGRNLNFSENSSLKLDGEGTTFTLKGSHGGLDICKMYLNASGNAAINLSNSAVLTSRDGTMYVTLSDSAKLNISSGASLTKSGAYSFINASGSSSINLSDGGSISGLNGISLSENASFNVSNMAFSANGSMTFADSASMNILDGGSYVIENNQAPVFGTSGSETANISLNISGSAGEGESATYSMLHFKGGSLNVTDGGSVNISDGAGIYFESDKTSEIIVGGETQSNAGQFIMTGGTISQTDGGANNLGRTFKVNGYGTMVLDAVTVEDLWRYTLITSDNATLTLKNGTTWSTSGRTRDIQIGGSSTFNIESGSVFSYNYYGAAGMDSFKIFENGVVNVVGEGSGIKTNSGSPTVTLAGNGIMNIKDGAYIGNSTANGTRQYYVSVTENSTLNLVNKGVMYLSAWNGNTNIVNVSDSGKINVDGGILNAGAYVNAMGYINFSDKSSLIVKNGGQVISDSSREARHTVWTFSGNSSISIEGSDNSVVMGSLNAAEGTKISFVADESGNVSTLHLNAPKTSSDDSAEGDSSYLSSISSVISIDFSNLNLLVGDGFECVLISSNHEWDISKYISSSESASDYIEVLTKNSGDTWYIEQSNNNLILSYTVGVPEPATWALIFGAGALVFALSRRRRQ